MGSREGVAAKIDGETQIRIAKMNQDVQSHKLVVIDDILKFVFDVKPEVHKNYLLKMKN